MYKLPAVEQFKTKLETDAVVLPIVGAQEDTHGKNAVGESITIFYIGKYLSGLQHINIDML